jgi:hypothetical protein
MQDLYRRTLTEENRRDNAVKIIQPMDYYHNISEEKIQQGDYELLGPGVMRVILDDEPTIFRHISMFHPLTMPSNASAGLWDVVDTVDGIEQVLAVILAAHHFNNRIQTDLVPDMMQKWSDCNVKLTLDIFDTRWLVGYATRQLLVDVLPRYNESSIQETMQQPQNVTYIHDEVRKYPNRHYWRIPISHIEYAVHHGRCIQFDSSFLLFSSRLLGQ